MKFEIISRSMKDQSLGSTIIKTLEYFATIHKDRSEQIERKPNKPDLAALMQDLVDYLETGLKKKYSINFNVLVSDMANYAIKFEKGCLLSLRYLNFSILIYKTPFICIPSKFLKPDLKQNELDRLSESFKRIEANFLTAENYLMLQYATKRERTVLKSITQDDITRLIFRNVAYFLDSAASTEEKDFLGNLTQGIQYDLSLIENNFSWGVVIAKKQIYSDSFIATSNVFYHSKLINNKINGEAIPKLKDAEFLIYHKTAEFESVFKSLVTGRFYNVEFKHVFILLSAVIFFIVTGLCPNDPAKGLSDGWFDRNVCGNKTSLLSTIGIMFIIIIISTAVKKRIDSKKPKQR